jgi:hypothetical protein
MTSINNIEELVRLLDERPEWSEALRTRVLTRDLLDLPATVGQRFTQVDDQFARMSAAIERLAEHTDSRFNEMTAAIERLAEHTNERFTQVDERFAAMSFAAMTAAIEQPSSGWPSVPTPTSPKWTNASPQ